MRLAGGLGIAHASLMAARHEHLSKREHQAMDIVYRRGKATAEDVQAEMPDDPSYSAVRALLGVLVEKKLLKYTRESRRYVYEPAIAPEKAADTALKKLLSTFFDGSPGKLVASLLNKKERKISAEEIASIRKLLDE